MINIQNRFPKAIQERREELREINESKHKMSHEDLMKAFADWSEHADEVLGPSE